MNIEDVSGLISNGWTAWLYSNHSRVQLIWPKWINFPQPWTFQFWYSSPELEYKSRSMMYQFWKTVSLPSSSSRRDLSHYSKKVVKLVHNSYECRQTLWIWWKKGLIHLLCSSCILRLFFCDLIRSSVSESRFREGRWVKDLNRILEGKLVNWYNPHVIVKLFKFNWRSAFSVSCVFHPFCPYSCMILHTYKAQRRAWD